MSLRVPTAPIAAAGLIAGFAVALATGSRPLGGVVLAAFGVVCISVWLARHGPRTTAMLTLAGLAAFGLSHVLGLAIGAWPAVLVTAAGVAFLYWRVSDSQPAPLALRSARARPRRSPRAGAHP